MTLLDSGPYNIVAQVVRLHQFWYLYWYQANTTIFDGIGIGQACYTNTNSVVCAFKVNFQAPILSNQVK